MAKLRFANLIEGMLFHINYDWLMDCVFLDEDERIKINRKPICNDKIVYENLL
jgi:hypothetical protein